MPVWKNRIYFLLTSYEGSLKLETTLLHMSKHTDCGDNPIITIGLDHGLTIDLGGGALLPAQ